VIVRNNARWTRLATETPGNVMVTCRVGFDFKSVRTVAVTYWRSKRNGKRYCHISPGRY
jgi:hypothetical protein